MQRSYHAWDSPNLGRKMELLLFGHAGNPCLLFPTSKGRFYQNEDSGLISAIADRIEAGHSMVACIDSVDEESWYNESVAPAARVRRHEQYESYVVNEAVPWLRERAQADVQADARGLQLRRLLYTMQIGLRHPTIFQKLLSMSGKFETEGFLDGHHDLGVYFHSALQWLPNLGDERILQQLQNLEIVLATGDKDFCKQSTEHLSGILWNKGIGNHLSVWRDADHDWPVWRQQIREYMP